MPDTPTPRIDIRPLHAAVAAGQQAEPTDVLLRITVPEAPEDLGMTPGTARTVTGQAIWHATCGACNMASVRMGAGSCCVIGDVPTENLVALLNAFER